MDVDSLDVGPVLEAHNMCTYNIMMMYVDIFDILVWNL